MVDLNNFSTFPTLAVGILVAALHNAGHDARVIVPLAHDVPATEREYAEDIRYHWERRLHLSTFPGFRPTRDWLRAMPGLTAIVEAAVEDRDLLQFRGMVLPDGHRSTCPTKWKRAAMWRPMPLSSATLMKPAFRCAAPCSRAIRAKPPGICT